MTARTSLRRRLTARGCAGPRTSRPRGGGRRAAGTTRKADAPREPAAGTARDSAGEHQRRRLGVERTAPRPRRRRGGARDAARAGRRATARPSSGDGGAARSGPATRRRSRSSSVPREQQRAEPDGRCRRAARARAGARVSGRERGAPTTTSSDHATTATSSQRRLQERERRAVEVDAEVGGAPARRSSSGRQERADAGRPARAPAPWRMSRRSFMGGTGTVRAHDDRRQGPGARGEATAREPACRTASSPPRARALRRPVRRAHAGHEVLGDARPDGAHRAPRGDLARRRPARHLDVPGRVVRARSCRTSPRTSTARGAAVRADRGHGRDRADAIAEVMAAEGTRGRPRGRPRHDRRPAGDRPRLQDADRPGRRHRRRGADLPGRRARPSAPTRPTSCRSRWTATACAIDVLEETLDRLEREGRRPKFIYTIPNFQNPGGVTMSLRAPPAAGRGRARARAARARGQPLRAAALRGRAAADAAARSTAATSSSTSARSRRSSRPACGSAGRSRPRPVLREDEHRQAGRRPLLVVADAAVRRRSTSPTRPLARLRRRRCATLYRAPPRRDARGARRALPGRGDVDAPAGRPVHLGDAARAASTRPTCSPARCARNVAFVPGRAAYLDGRGGSLDAAELLRRRRATRSARACAGSARSSASRSTCSAR